MKKQQQSQCPYNNLKIHKAIKNKKIYKIKQ